MSTKPQSNRSWDPDRRQVVLKSIGHSMRKLHPIQKSSDLPKDMQTLLKQLEEVERTTACQSA